MLLFGRLRSFVFLIFVSTFFLGTLNLFSDEGTLLKISDINNVMKQVFAHHVEKKEMTTFILKQSLKMYLDQFDPDRVYLLESEALSFESLDPSELQKYFGEYKKGDYTIYKNLNGMIQKAIYRSREYRQALENNMQELFVHNEFKGHDFLDPDIQIPFAKNLDNLKSRIHDRLVEYIVLQKKRFGAPLVMAKKDQAIAQYERDIRQIENRYLFQNEQGEPLSDVEQEHYFALHILKAIASSLDAHTTFFDTAEANDMRVNLEKDFYGVGIVLQEALGDVVVVGILPGSPAEKSEQIKVNDRLIEVDGKQLNKVPFQDVLKMIQGKNNSKVTLLLKRPSPDNKSEKVVKVTLTRAPVVMKNDRVDVSSVPFGDGIIGKITLHGFYENDEGISSEEDMRNAIEGLKKKGHLRGLVLDLRENSGGFLTQAVKVAGLFIKSGIVVISKYSNGEQHFYRDVDAKIAYDGPLVILVSRETASAAEIVAEALQDYGVALIVGDDHTYGKGSIQTQTVTDSKAPTSFKVTVGKYYTVSGKSPQIKGVISDIVVPGPYMYEEIGEKYLGNALPLDTISPNYNDPLIDVDAKIKPWYLKYYVPTLQHRKDTWAGMVPKLKKNSQYRLDHNKDYQLFLKTISGAPVVETKGDEIDQTEESQKNKNFGVEDLQMNEAVNIIKDMIMLYSHYDSHTVGNPTNR